MFDDFFDSVKATLYDRVISPLWGAFALSWVAWNHRMLFVLFSDSMETPEKFGYLRTHLYPTLQDYFCYWGVGPALTAAAVIAVVPAVGEAAYIASRFWKVRLKEAKIHWDGETPISRQEADQVRARSLTDKQKSEGRIGGLLKERDVMQVQIEELQKERGSQQERIEKLESDLAQANSDLESLLGAMNAKPEGLAQLRFPLSSHDQTQLESMLIRDRYELTYNPKSTNGHKSIEFKPDGSIGEGHNDNEHTWRVDQEGLKLYTSSGDLQNHFVYDEQSDRLVADQRHRTKALPNQYIEKRSAD